MKTFWTNVKVEVSYFELLTVTLSALRFIYFREFTNNTLNRSQLNFRIILDLNSQRGS